MKGCIHNLEPLGRHLRLVRILVGMISERLAVVGTLNLLLARAQANAENGVGASQSVHRHLSLPYARLPRGRLGRRAS